MTPGDAVVQRAIDLAGEWPRDRTVPRRIKALHDAAQGHYKQQIGMVVEALVVASTSQEDVNLVTRYFQSR